MWSDTQHGYLITVRELPEDLVSVTIDSMTRQERTDTHYWAVFRPDGAPVNGGVAGGFYEAKGRAQDTVWWKVIRNQIDDLLLPQTI